MRWGIGVGGGGWGGAQKVPAASISKPINDIEMKFDGIVENYKLIHLV